MVIGKVVAGAHGDGVVGAGLLAQSAVDATQQIDLVALGVPLARRDSMFGRIFGCLDDDAPDRAGDRAKLASDTLFQPVGVAVEDVAATLPGWDRLLPLRVLDGDDRAAVVLEGGPHRARDVHRSQQRLLERRHQAFPCAATTTTAVIIIIASDSGSSDFHPSAISRSYRMRGKVARSQTYTYSRTTTFSRNHQGPGRMPKGPHKPQRNTVVAMALTMIMLMYSAMKKRAKRMPEYSV